MKKTVRRLFPVWAFEEEEQWLRNMAEDGYVLTGVGWSRYEFEEREPCSHDVALDLLEYAPAAPESVRYISFLEEAGWEYVGSVLRWAYFRRKREGEAAALYSDSASRVKYLTRALRLIALVGGLNLMIGGCNLTLYGLNGLAVSLLGLVNIALAVLCGYGAGKVRKKKQDLEREENRFQ